MRVEKEEINSSVRRETNGLSLDKNQGYIERESKG